MCGDVLVLGNPLSVKNRKRRAIRFKSSFHCGLSTTIPIAINGVHTSPEKGEQCTKYLMNEANAYYQIKAFNYFIFEASFLKSYSYRAFFVPSLQWKKEI